MIRVGTKIYPNTATNKLPPASKPKPTKKGK